MAHITVYKGTSKPFKKFRSSKSFNKFFEKIFGDTSKLIFHETLHNSFSVLLADRTKTLYSVQIVE